MSSQDSNPGPPSSSNWAADADFSAKPIRTADHNSQNAAPDGNKDASSPDKAPKIVPPLVAPAFEGPFCINCRGFDDPFLDGPRVEVLRDTPLTEMPYFCIQCRIELVKIAGWDFELMMRQLLFHLRNESCRFNYWFQKLQKCFSSDGEASKTLLKGSLPYAIVAQQSLVDQLRKMYAEKKPGTDVEIPQEVLDIKTEIRARLREANILHDLGKREFFELASDEYALETAQKDMMLNPGNYIGKIRESSNAWDLDTADES